MQDPPLDGSSNQQSGVQSFGECPLLNLSLCLCVPRLCLLALLQVLLTALASVAIFNLLLSDSHMIMHHQTLYAHPIKYCLRMESPPKYDAFYSFKLLKQTVIYKEKEHFVSFRKYGSESFIIYGQSQHVASCPNIMQNKAS